MRTCQVWKSGSQLLGAVDGRETRLRDHQAIRHGQCSPCTTSKRVQLQSGLVGIGSESINSVIKERITPHLTVKCHSRRSGY